jgi:hypothetical protein
MTSLRNLQRQFVGVLFEELPDTEVSWVCTQGDSSQLRGGRRAETAARLAIYRNNLHEGFIKALALEFPVIQRLVGDDYFRQLAREFLQAHPSRDGDLHPIGCEFPGYLLGRFLGTDYAYLPDVARLEWAYEMAAVAADAAAFDPHTLQYVAPESYAELRFQVHPACHLVSSVYPILEIWRTNMDPAADGERVDLASGPDHVATRRVKHSVELVRLPAADYTLLESLSARATLHEAVNRLQEVDSQLDLGRSLRGLIELGMISGLHTDTVLINKGILP